MNCETCQELIHDLVDGSISQRDEFTLNTHLKECLDCESVRQDLASIVGFCRTQRGQYEAPPNAQAMWLRIRNVIEAELPKPAVQNEETKPSFLARLMGRSWELSLPQLAASTAAIVLVVSLVTVVGLRRFGGYGPAPVPPTVQADADASNLNDRVWQRRQVIDYWNQRVELNKARWNPEMRATFDRGVKQIDEAIATSLDELKRNPHDEFYEEMLNDSLNNKINLLKDFSDL
jgi:anti-sigma factor RsiW